MLNPRANWSTILLLVAVGLGTLGVALHAADEAAPKTPEEILGALVAECEWSPQWVEDGQAYQVIFRGPDVWVRLSGDYVVVQSYLGRMPKEAAANELLGLLRRNYDLYEGKYALDKENDLWFETSSALRILDAEQLDQQIAVVADAAANTSSIIKLEPAGATP